MHFLNKQCVFTSIGLGLISLGILLAVFWMDIFRALLANVRSILSFLRKTIFKD